MISFFPGDAMLCYIDQYSVCLSVCDALQAGLPVPCSHRLDLKFFEKNFTAE